MPHSDLDHHFKRIDDLVAEMNQFVPIDERGVSDFRADLAGMLVVAIAAMYESCAKETMVSYAAKQHSSFESFAAKNFDRLNSRIRVRDLRRYCSVFDPEIRTKFNTLYNHRKQTILAITGKRVEDEFDRILDWRHDFAHAGLRNTTIEEAIKTHRIGRFIMLTFHDAFH